MIRFVEPDPEPPVWRTAQEIAALFQVQLRTVWAWRRRGHITPVDGRYDLAAVLRWYETARDAQMEELRTHRLANRRSDRVYLNPGRPHAQELSVAPARIGSVDFGATFAPAEPEADDRVPHPWEGILDAGLSPVAQGRLITRYLYLQRLGIEIDQALFDRMVAVERAAASDAANDPAPQPTVIVYYIRVGDLIKIGQTVDIAGRLKSYPPNAVLLATEVGERDALEAERHRQFADTLAHRREWFHPSAALIEHINSLREQPLTAAELVA